MDKKNYSDPDLTIILMKKLRKSHRKSSVAVYDLVEITGFF